MANVTEHHSKQERECDAGKDGRIDFFILWNIVLICDHLEDFSKLICDEESRWRYFHVVFGIKFDKSGHFKVLRIGLLQFFHNIAYSGNTASWNPTEALNCL